MGKGFDGLFKHFDGNLVLRGFDTEHDLELCKKALERMLNCMAEMSFYNVNKELEPYRRKCAKEMDKQICTEQREDYKEQEICAGFPQINTFNTNEELMKQLKEYEKQQTNKKQTES